jgi:hypothetical protein
MGQADCSITAAPSPTMSSSSLSPRTPASASAHYAEQALVVFKDDLIEHLRHAALSSWLNAGVDPTEVAERAGNSVEVLLSRYAKCLDGRQDIANSRIAELFGEDGDQEHD